jgi:hypothetical protein
MKRFREVVQSALEPEDKNVLWLDISDSENPLLKYYFAEEWVTLAGGGGPGPSPSKLKNTYYYGALNARVTTATIDVSLLSETRYTSATGNFNEIYYYIVLAEDQSIVSVITQNQENIGSQFNFIGTLLVDGNPYKLYEFYLDTLVPLDVTATISITGNTK